MRFRKWENYAAEKIGGGVEGSQPIHLAFGFLGSVRIQKLRHLGRGGTLEEIRSGFIPPVAHKGIEIDPDIERAPPVVPVRIEFARPRLAGDARAEVGPGLG